MTKKLIELDKNNTLLSSFDRLKEARRLLGIFRNLEKTLNAACNRIELKARKK